MKYGIKPYEAVKITDFDLASLAYVEQVLKEEHDRQEEEKRRAQEEASRRLE